MDTIDGILKVVVWEDKREKMMRSKKWWYVALLWFTSHSQQLKLTQWKQQQIGFLYCQLIFFSPLDYLLRSRTTPIFSLLLSLGPKSKATPAATD